MRRVLSLIGVDDSGLVLFHGLGPHGPVYSVRGCVDPCRNLEHPGIQADTLLLGGRDARTLPDMPAADLVFNAITDADSCSKALGMARELLRQVDPAKIINHPDIVARTRRDDVATTLAGIAGLVVPATLRIRPSARREILEHLADGPVRYPAILRRTGTHGGQSMLLLRSPDDADRLERIACDGSEYYLIQFIDYRSADGAHRKLRLVMVDGQPWPRHLLASKYWNVHASSRSGLMARGTRYMADEARFLATFDKVWRPRLDDRLAAIQQRLGLDYYSIDCALLPDGELLLFEANASGNVLQQDNLHRYPHLRRPLQNLRKAVAHMLLERKTAP